MTPGPPLDLTFAICIAFLVSEMVLSRVRRSKSMKQDGGSLRWLHWTIGFSITVAVSVSVVGIGSASLPELARVSLCIGPMIVGAVIRWVAIAQLGKRFTVAVEVQDGHTLMRDGLYRFVRHPSYSGLMLQFIGLGFYFNNWITQVFILVPITASLLYRIRVEESVLRKEFGDQYEEYARTTKRLIPGIW